jgi:hypothetical protein
MAKRDRRDSLRRRRAFRAPRPRFLIVCEGTQTEPEYFKEIRHLERSLIDLTISPGGVPKTLVERAVEMKKAAVANAKRQKDDNQKYDYVWCVFDVDEHPLVPEAQQKARDNSIEVALSNPSFELWALLHFRNQSAHIERGPLHHECKLYMPGYEKRLPTTRLYPLVDDATQRARDLDHWQVSRDCGGANPSTGVYRLVEQIRLSDKST